MAIDPILGAIIASAIGGAISSLTAPEPPKVERTAQDKHYEALVKRYKAIGERRQLAHSAAALLSGKPESEFKGTKGDVNAMEIIRNAVEYKDIAFAGDPTYKGKLPTKPYLTEDMFSMDKSKLQELAGEKVEKTKSKTKPPAIYTKDKHAIPQPQITEDVYRKEKKDEDSNL